MFQRAMDSVGRLDQCLGSIDAARTYIIQGVSRVASARRVAHKDFIQPASIQQWRQQGDQPGIASSVYTRGATLGDAIPSQERRD